MNQNERKLAEPKFYVVLFAFVTMLLFAVLGTEEVLLQAVSLVFAGGIMISYIIVDGLIDKEIAGSNVTVTVDKSGQEAQDKS